MAEDPNEWLPGALIQSGATVQRALDLTRDYARLLPVPADQTVFVGEEEDLGEGWTKSSGAWITVTGGLSPTAHVVYADEMIRADRGSLDLGITRDFPVPGETGVTP